MQDNVTAATRHYFWMHGYQCDWRNLHQVLLLRLRLLARLLLWVTRFPAACPHPLSHFRRAPAR